MPAPSVYTPAFKVYTNAYEDTQPIVAASPDGSFGIYWGGVVGAVFPFNDPFILGFTYRGETFGSDGAGVVYSNGSGAIHYRSALGTAITNPDVAFLTNGDKVTVVQANTDIYFRIDAKVTNGNYGNGEYVNGFTSLVNADALQAGNQSQPEVAALSGGGFVVAWEDDTTQKVYSQVYTSAGAAVAGAITIRQSISTQTAGDYNLDLVGTNNGGYALSYMSDFGGAQTSLIRFFSSNANLLGGSGSNGTTGTNYETAIAQNGFSETAFVFNGNNGTDTVFRIIGSDLVPATGDIVLSDNRNSGETPRVSALLDGRFMIVYSSAFGGPVIGQIVNRNGTLDGASFVVAANGYQPEIETTADGRVVVTWREGSGAAGDIYAAVYDPREAGVFVQGTDERDSFIGSNYDDTFQTVDGNDTVYGFGGNDVILLSSGADLAVGGAGNDFIQGDDNSTSENPDTLYGEAGNDTLIGGYGYSFFGNILVGGTGDDSMKGADGNDSLYGGSDNDSLVGETGSDLMLGDGGDDTIEGGYGNDFIYSGTGINDMFGGSGDDVFISEGSFDIMFGGADHNYYYRTATGSSAIFGSTGIDEFVGGGAASNDTFRGGGGNDFAFGGNGNDYLRGEAGNDVLIGQNGNDTLEGGAGVNLLWANDIGNDQIFVNALDGGTQVVEFFEAGGTNDVVRLLGSSLTSFAGIQNLVTNIGVAQGANLLVNAGSGAQLYLNLGANQTAIWFQGVSAYSLTSSDFLFS
jgi:hypothetical protein